MDPINIQYSLEILSPESAVQSGTSMEPSAVAVEHFQQSMQNPALAPADAPAGDIAPVSATGSSNPTMGDKILQGLQNMKSGYDDQVGAVQNSLAGPDPLSMQDMMKLQLDLAKLTMQGELINKTVSKSTQNLDTLLKSQ